MTELKRYMFTGAPKCLHIDADGTQCGRLANIDAQWFELPDANQVCETHKQKQVQAFADLVLIADLFQNAVPCWHPDWYWPSAKERRSERLVADYEYRKRVGRI